MGESAEKPVVEADGRVAGGALFGEAEPGEFVVVGGAVRAAGAGAPGLEPAGEVDDAGIGNSGAGEGVPALIEAEPVRGEDGVEGFLVEKVGVGAGLGEVLAGERGDIALAPAGEIDEEHSGVEIGSVRGDIAGLAILDAARGAAGENGLIDGGGDGLRGERGMPEGGDVGADEKVGIEEEDALDVGREEIGQEEGEGGLDGETGGADGGGELGRGELDGPGFENAVALFDVGGR